MLRFRNSTVPELSDRPSRQVLRNRDAPLMGELAHSKAWQLIYQRDGIVVYVPESDSSRSFATN